MRTFLKNLLLNQWPRKVLSLVIAAVIWFFVNYSLTVTKMFPNVGVRVINIPAGKTIQGLESNGILNKRISLTIMGNKTALEDLTNHDFEVLIDAQNREGEWIASIDKNNLSPLNPELDLNKAISKVNPQSLPMRFTKIDFLRNDVIPLNRAVPLTVFVPDQYAETIDPRMCHFIPNALIHTGKNLSRIHAPLFTRGVSPLFVQIVREFIQLCVIASPDHPSSELEWSIQFLNPRALEDRYVAARMAYGEDEELKAVQAGQREEFLRSRFRNYMTHFQLTDKNGSPLHLHFQWKNNGIVASKNE